MKRQNGSISNTARMKKFSFLLVSVFLFFIICAAFSEEARAATIYLHPQGAGTSTQWTKTGAEASNWQVVNDEAGNAASGGPSTNDGATSYVSTNSLNLRDMFALGDDLIPAGSTITALTVYATHARAANPGSTIKVSYQINGAGYNDSATSWVSGGAYTTVSQQWTGLNWTVADLNTLEVGVVISAAAANASRVTQVYALVTYTPPPDNAPTLSISQPDGTGDTVTVGQNYSITYSLADAEEVVQAAFYYDTDNTGLNGAAITGACATAAEGSNVTCSWNTTGVTPGTYYVYGIANDGVNPAVNAYSPGMITINAGGGAASLIHNSAATGSSKHAADGGWGVAGAKYGEFTCETCHTRSTTNIKRVKQSITTPDTSKGTLPGNNQPIVFSKTSGNPGDAGVMGDDSTTPRATSNKICEICHTYDATSANGVKVHPYNSAGATINLSTHQNNSTDCTQCHKHSEGFKKAACDSCHGNPPTDNSAGGPTGLANSPYPTGSTTAGAHNAHVATLGFSDCNNCHNGYVMPQESSVKTGFGDISIGFNNFGSTTGSYSGQAGLSYNDTLGTGGLTCSTVYCHGSTLTAGIDPAPAWTDAPLACGTCHGASPATPPTAGSHQRHAGNGAGQLAIACADCHGPHALKDGHVDGAVTWSLNNTLPGFGSAPAYNGLVSGTTGTRAPSAAYQGCSNTYCHSQGTSNTSPYPAPNIAATWGGTLDGTCTGCHSGNASAANKMATFAHDAHTNDTTNQVGFNVGCATCHSATVSGDTTISGAQYHVNKSLNIRFNNGTLLKDTDLPTYNTQDARTTAPAGATRTPGGTPASCSNVYCHSIGNLDATGAVITADGANFRTVAWDTTIAGCDDCHGDSASGKAHPVYTSGAAGSTTANSHVKHVEGSSLSCDYCHDTTTTNATIPPTTVVAAGQHLDRTEDVSFKTNGGKTGSYDGTAKTCSTTYCHGTGPSVAWGGSTTCSSCHGASNNGDLSSGTAGHAKHFQSVTVPSTITDGNAHTTTAYVFACSNCHPTATHAQGPADGTGPVLQDAQVNGTRQTAANYTQGGSSTTDARGFNYTNGTCSTVCHTKDGSTLGSGIVATPAWNGTNALGCGYCHNKAGDAAPTWTTPHTVHVNTYGVTGGNTNINCEVCHTGTAANNSALQATAAARQQHPDTNKNVAFGTFSGGAWSGTQCSNTYCHSNGTSTTGSHANISWSGSMDIECDSCHGGNASSTVATGKGPIATNAHGAHMSDSGNQVGFNVGCSECHSATVSADRTLASMTYHVNKTLNIRFDNGTRNKNTDLPLYNGVSAQSTVAGGATATPGAQATCSNVYCHSVGNLDATGAVVAVGSPVVSFRTVTWNTGTLGCAGCHGDSASGKSHPVYTSGTAGSTTANSHVKHVEGSSLSCDYCHDTTTTNATIPPTTVVAAGQHLDRTEDVSFKTNGGKTGSYDGTAKTCSTTYCHGTGPSVAWGGSTTCSSCHGASNTGDLSGTTGATQSGHTIHYGSATAPAAMTDPNQHTISAYVYACSNCHPTGTHATGPSDGTGPVLQDAQINGTKQMTANYTQGGSSATDAKGFNYTNGSCTTVCHTADGVSAAPKVAPVWSTLKTANNCGSCHNKAGDATPTWSAPHTLHINSYTANGNLTCNACHAGTAADNTTINTVAGRNQHPNAVKNVELNAWVVSSGTGTWSTNQCSNTYCHSAGTAFTSPTHAAISWSGNTTCSSCHTGGTTTGPSYVNGTPKTNSHAKHTGAPYTYVCVDCHSGTVNAANAITGFANHIDKEYDVTGTKITTYTYAADGGTCSTSCHASTTPKWGQTSAGCTFCHPTLSGRHSSHVVFTNTSVYGSTSVNVSGSSTNYDFGCGNCHPTAAANHMNGTIELSLNPADGGTLKAKNVGPTIAGSGLTTQCNGVYCHSDGKAAPAFVQTPQWQNAYASSWNTCGNCHGNSPAGSNHTAHVVGIHYDNIYTGTSGLAAAGTLVSNSHGNATASTTINCNICHNGAVTKSRNKYGSACTGCHSVDADNTTNAMVAADLVKTLHVNGQPDVAFAAVQVKSKAQVRDDITSVAELNNNWARPASSYKTGATPYDTAKNALNTATMWNGGSKTCSNIACHNGFSVTWNATVTCTSCHTSLP